MAGLGTKPRTSEVLEGRNRPKHTPDATVAQRLQGSWAGSKEAWSQPGNAV